VAIDAVEGGKKLSGLSTMHDSFSDDFSMEEISTKAADLLDTFEVIFLTKSIYLLPEVY